MKVLVQHWESHTGEVSGASALPKGVSCWVFTDDTDGFKEWMVQNCPTADVTLRFNSGNPAFIIFIYNNAEISQFTLRWK